jgi:hypothetical protein
MLQKAKYVRREKPELSCRVCPRSAAALKCGMCQPCYLRAYRGTALPPAARCARPGCVVKNPIVLVRTASGVRCYNCRALDRAAA